MRRPGFDYFRMLAGFLSYSESAVIIGRTTAFRRRFHAYCGSMPASFIIFANSTSSVLIRPPNSSGVLAITRPNQGSTENPG
jgi:hypothetical protein